MNKLKLGLPAALPSSDVWSGFVGSGSPLVAPSPGVLCVSMLFPSVITTGQQLFVVTGVFSKSLRIGFGWIYTQLWRSVDQCSP